MKRLLAILTCLFAATIDALAVIIASGTWVINPFSNWQIATLLHLVSVIIVGFSFARYRHCSDSPTVGIRTVTILAITLSLCAPVAGALAVSCLLAGFTTHTQTVSIPAAVVIGNPLRNSNTDPATSPIVRSQCENCLVKLREAGPLLHRNSGRQSVTVLRRLQRHNDARIQLQAQGALASLSETFEKQIAQLRHMHSSPENSRRLASMLHQVAISGIRDEVTSNAMLEEAMQHLEHSLAASPGDAGNITALHLLAECQLAAHQVSNLPELISQLRNQTDGAAFADKIERRYHATLGHWRQLAASVHDTCLNTTVASRNFWAGSPPLS